jgi:predicted enzyme related to lactoylglutathione lyase
MAHYSRLSMIVVDVPAENHEAAITFWQGALGVTLDQVRRYPEFHGGELPFDGYAMLVQRLGDGPPKVHLDLHTSDRAAEVARLRGLGATLVEDGENWAVMRDPAGLVFCVVPDKTLDATNARAWG